MISYDEPVRARLSESEQRSSEARFLLVLHGFLCLYLALHNLLIPVTMNWLRGTSLLVGVHYWFLAQFIVAWALRESVAVSVKVMTVVSFGSFLRLVMETAYWMPATPNWTIFSVWLSEAATLIFAGHFFFRSTVRPAWRWWWLSLLAPLISVVEIRERVPAFATFLRVAQQDAGWVTRGCKGSRITWSPGQKMQTDGRVQTCGFSAPLAAMQEPLRNLSKETVQLRVSRLRLWNGEPKLQFVRLLILRPGSSHVLEGKHNEVWLLSSIQQKWVGLQLRVGEDAAKVFPTGTYYVDPYELRYQEKI